MIRSRLKLYLLVALTFGICSYVLIKNPKPDTPNIVLIFFDDLGYGDLSCYGALDIQTPNIDLLATQGIRFTNFLSAQAVCSASRAALMTGCYPNRIGISGALFPNANNGISSQETTIAEVLKQRGYRAAIFGKWHLGDKLEHLPLQHGFDEYFGIPYSNDMWPVDYDGKPATTGNKLRFPTLPLIEGNKIADSLITLDDQALLTKKYTEKAIGFIEKNKKQPFFLYMPHSMPHVPIAASKDFVGTSRQGMYGDVVQELDWSVGEIMKTLAKNNLDENTLVILTSDNGPWLNFGNHAGNAGGLREGKGTSFEGGQREPCIIKWTSVIPEGRICNQLCSTIDLFPTITKLAGGKLPDHKIDGLDISSLLSDPASISPRSTFYYYYRRNALEAVRKDHWKYVFPHPGRSYLNQAPGKDGFPGPSPENVNIAAGLYDLRRDPAEQYDVSAYNPEVVAELLKLGETARADLGDDLTDRKGTGVRTK